MRSKAQNSVYGTKPANRQFRARIQRGFTFMELLIVMVIIAILAAVAIPKYLSHLRRAKEVVLKQDLWAMRRAIDYYTTDKEKPPSSLQELVSAQYLREIPKDPMCPDCTWSEVPAVSDNSLNSSGGIGDVKSSAPGTDSNGVPFSEY
ncbi:MAG TPA: prepilin-type N-terminal cleavage/methylation domain-containing protein [Blastocatellia bacterium]|nr:prepilin-type N-terminal cleavage/methylation domain-containing protein [Blastocatellia bacterium]HMX25535.1 prepilin-type N-terminal cleavage/methylation domain-containing protein [Blastocatellia bacterium]HMY74923.1 prepilin-type N-terminal cleavage/methylation domain-containing protein [Blastocatellia bacterium]HMZ21346.1 prepilin-type N-terminal cleavage/methylation domain-containing protein [Blastocatellia bacterium]HNG30163.1 prepilin-type N-terminal cleavage/methylation domain-contain